MALILEIKPAEGPQSRIRLQPGNNRFTVRVGDVYRIFDDQTGLTPEGVTVKRIDNSLVVDGLPSGGEPTSVEFAEFYTLCSAGSPCTLEVQPSLGSAPVAVTPATSSIGALADGSFVLYDPSYVPPEPPPDQSGYDPRIAWYGLGALAIAGLAAGGGGGGGGGGGPPVGRNDGTLKYTGSPFVNSHTPTLVGEGEPGAQVLVRIDIDGNGTPDVSYATTVGADFRWQINLATAVPTSGALPPGGLPDAVTIGITSETSQGLVSLEPFVLAFDGVPPAPAVVNAVATDNVVNGPEKAAGVVVSGTSEPNGSVVVTWGGQSMASAVSAAGTWQATFAAAAVPADGSQPISVVARDQAGNAAEATVVAVTVDTRPPSLAVESVAGEAGVNGVVAVADSATVSFRGTSDPGASVQLSWNGIERGAAAGGDGRWTIDFTGAEVPASAGGNFVYNVVASNAVGNAAAAGGNVFVDLQPPPAPLIATVAGDNIVTPAERGAGVPVTGTAEPNAQVTVTWGSAARQVQADAAGAWQVGFASGELPSVPSPGANTTITARATDAVGNSGETASLPVFIQQPFQPPTISVVAGDDLVNAAERAAGVTLSGTVNSAAPGVTVTWGSFTATDSSVSGGSWSIAVPAGQVPTTSANVFASIAGSPEISASRAVAIDVTPPAPPGINVVEGDDIVSVIEGADGVGISGTAEAGSSVRVTWGTNSKVDTADGAGNWSVSFTPAELPAAGPGTVSAVATDAAGNEGTASTRAVTVQAPFGAPTINTVEGDNVVNLAERADGVTLSGTVQAGATGLSVQWGGFSGDAQVTGGGWTLTVPAGQVPGDGNTTITATITGPGGGAQASQNVLIDTTPPGAPVVNAVTGDDSISLIEGSFGFPVSGVAEANSTVTVALGSIASTTVTAGADGSWTTSNFLTAGQPAGTVTLSVHATDNHGNVGPATQRPITIEGLLGSEPPAGGLEAFPGTSAVTAPSPSLDALVAMEDPARHFA